MTMFRMVTAAAVCALLFSGCGSTIVTLHSRTYEKMIAKANPAADELYVDMGRLLDLDFSGATTLTRHDPAFAINEIHVGDQVSDKGKTTCWLSWSCRFSNQSRCRGLYFRE